MIRDMGRRGAWVAIRARLGHLRPAWGNSLRNPEPRTGEIFNDEIAFAFGFALIAMAYGIGPISGCHINPAVSLGVYAAGRMSAADLGS